jgi:GTP 3',8-cyclase
MLDKNGRNINYMRISVTDRCNYRCIYCMPEEGEDNIEHTDILRYEEILKIVKASAHLGINKIRFTGGEPLILKGIDKLINETSKVPGIKDIAITTNGSLLADMAVDLKKSGLKRVNVSLDTLDAEKFKKITRVGNINSVFKAIEKCIAIGLAPVKINCVVIKGINDDEIADLIHLADEYPIEIRFIEIMPIGEGTKFYNNDGLITSEELVERFPQLIEMPSSNMLLGSTAKLYKKANSKGNVGFISPMSCKFCSSCNRIRLTSVGTIKPCLHSEGEVDLKKYIHSEVGLLAALKNSIFEKPQGHFMETDKHSRTHKKMYEIGG